jgi:hypothetical protein
MHLGMIKKRWLKKGFEKMKVEAYFGGGSQP